MTGGAAEAHFGGGTKLTVLGKKSFKRSSNIVLASVTILETANIF